MQRLARRGALSNSGMDACTAESVTMPTKNASQPVGPYLAAHRRAYAWADKALGYRRAGKPSQAEAAARKARLWLAKALTLNSHRVH